MTTGRLLVALAIALSPACRRQDAGRASRRGRRSTPRRSAQTCHAIAGKGSKANPLDGVGAKLSRRRHQGSGSPTRPRWRRRPSRPRSRRCRQVRQAAGGRPRRARRLHAEPEVAGTVPSRATLAPPSARDRRRGARPRSSAVVVHRAGHCRRRWTVRESVRGPGRLRRRARPVRARAAAHPARDVAGSAADSGTIQRPRATGRSSTSGKPTTRRTVLAVTALTAVNVVIVLLAG